MDLPLYFLESSHDACSDTVSLYAFSSTVAYDFWILYRIAQIWELRFPPYLFSGGPDTLNWLGSFNLERILGNIPIESNGTAIDM